MMTWYDAEREIGYRKEYAVAAGERSRLLREVEAMQAQQRRAQRMKLMAYLSDKWQAIRRVTAGEDAQVAAAMDRLATGTGRNGG